MSVGAICLMVDLTFVNMQCYSLKGQMSKRDRSEKCIYCGDEIESSRLWLMVLCFCSDALASNH
jgi:hypothetical protein